MKNLLLTLLLPLMFLTSFSQIKQDLMKDMSATELNQFNYNNSKIKSEPILRLDSIYDAYVCYSYGYNYNGKVTYEIRSDKLFGIWTFSWKWEYFYNTDGEITYYINSAWDKEKNNWINDLKYEIIYNEIGKDSLFYSYHWDIDSDEWIFSQKLEFNYDDNENILLEILYKWNSELGIWIMWQKIEFIYNSDGTLNQQFEYIWNINTTQWDISTKTDYAYNENGKKILEILFTWNLEASLWDSNWKYEYIYDNFDNLITTTRYKWDSDSNQWSGWRKNVYTIDYSYSGNDLLVPPYYYNWTNKVIERNEFYWEDEQWILDYDFVYYYSELFTNISESDILGKMISPNPLTNFTTVFINHKSSLPINIYVFNTSGICIKNWEFNNQQTGEKKFTLNLIELSRGVYFISIQVGQDKITKKIVKL